MVVFPNAKINIGLNIINRRDDGYHNLESCFYPINWKDVLEIVPSNTLKFIATGIPIFGNEEDNLCLKAYHLLVKDYDLPSVNIHLHKVIPMGAGIGGGSSDGTFTLIALNDLFKLGLNKEQIIQYSKKLGADCPFFVNNSPVFVKGTGDVFESIDLQLKDKWITLVKSKAAVNTTDAFSKITPQVPANSIKDVLSNTSIIQWKENIVNDFKEAIFVNFPELKSIEETLQSQGALYTSMSGTGSTIYGIFDHEIDWKNKFDSCLIFQAQLE